MSHLKRLVLFFIILFPILGSAQTPGIYLSNNSTSTHPTHRPIGTIITVDAIITNNNDKGVIWTSSGGTLTNATCTANGPCTVGITSTTVTTGSAISLTATSHANGSVAKTLYVWFDATPTPTASNVTPFLITPANLSTLQARATTSNLLWNSILHQATTELANEQSIYSWTYTCNGGTGAPSTFVNYPWDNDGYLFALVGELNPSLSTGVGTCTWSQLSRDVWIYTLTNVQNGNISMTGNVWSDESINFTLGLNIALSSGAISGSDVTTVRNYMVWWLHDMLTGGGFTGVTAPYNNYYTSLQFNQGSGFDLGSQRYMGNNYTQSKMLYLIAYSLMFHDDTSNDPNLTGSSNTCSASRYVLCSDYTGGSLHAYWNYVTGAMMFKEWAHLEDPAVVIPTYSSTYPTGGITAQFNCVFNNGGSSGPCIGDGWGGESSEGSWYAYSFYRLRLALNMIDSAGYNNPITYGPALSMGSSAFWDLKTLYDRSFLTTYYGTSGNPQSGGFGFFTTGDTYQNEPVRAPTNFATQAMMLTADTFTQRTDQVNDELWMVMDTAYGGINGTNGGCSAYCGYLAELANDYASSTVFDMFLTQTPNDPTTLAPTDPSSNYPLTGWNNSFNQHQIYRTGWGTSASTLFVYGPNSQIDHEHTFQGRFDIFANGGYITKGRTEWDNYNDIMSSAQFSNMVGIIDAPGIASGYGSTCLSTYTAPYGGQLWHGFESAISFANHSEEPTYSYYGMNQAPAYNGCSIFGTNQFTDTQQAYRDILFIAGSNEVLVYDRDAIIHSSSSYAWYLNTTGNPTITGNVSTWNTQSGGQSAQLVTLLPSAVTISSAKLVNYLEISAPYLNLQSGTNMQGVCTAYYADGTTANVSSSAVWSLSSTSNATISSSGLITGTSAASGITASCSYGGTHGGASGVFNVIAGASNGTFVENVPDTTQTVDWEPQAQIIVTPSGSPLSSNFMHSLVWGAVGFTAPSSSLVQSTSGQGFDCTKIGTNLGCFMRTLATFTGMTIPASSATSFYITNLSPSTTYSVSGTGAPSTVTTDEAGVAQLSATGTGNLSLGLITPPSNTIFLGSFNSLGNSKIPQ